MRIITDTKYDFSDVLLTPKRSELSSRNQIVIERKFSFLHSDLTWTGVPIVASNMDTTGTIETAKVLTDYGMLTCLHKFYEEDDLKDNLSDSIKSHIAISSGIKSDELTKNIDLIKKLGLNIICLDVANGYTEIFVEAIKKVRSELPGKIIIAGNVATPEMTEALLLAGADIIKIGIGPGSACTTRKKTGVGYPQLSAIIECADAAHGLGGQIMADGGCKVPGDVSKAFAAGADFVMLGGMLAGHKESGGELIEEDGKLYKNFYGMSSAQAMTKHYGGVKKYRSAEGKSVKIPYRGELSRTIDDILGGIRSTCTYIGAKRIKDLPKCATFVKVRRQLNTVYGE